MSRRPQILLIACTLVGAWLAMQAVHECGHALAAWTTGGRVKQMVLHPLTISRTDVEPNPRPLVVAWAGPLFGAIAPLFCWLILAKTAPRVAPLARFFAGFCLIANGLYLGFGSIDRVGDCGDLLSHGARFWQLWAFCAATVPLGFGLWNGQGRHFGLGAAQGKVDERLVRAAIVFALATLALGLVVGGR
ncbi:MAG TPA: M50 family metallopeptidase [Pirellulales bacterium]